MNKLIPIYKIIHALLFGSIYFVLECIWKCTLTDWRMFVLAAVIGVMIGCINDIFNYDTNFLLQCFLGTLIALLCECIFGYQWNVVQGLAIWDYSDLPFSAVAGQINLFFGLAWMFLSGVCIVLDDSLHYYVWKHDGKVDRPFYRIGEKRWYLPEKK